MDFIPKAFHLSITQQTPTPRVIKAISTQHQRQHEVTKRFILLTLPLKSLIVVPSISQATRHSVGGVSTMNHRYRYSNIVLAASDNIISIPYFHRSNEQEHEKLLPQNREYKAEAGLKAIIIYHFRFETGSRRSCLPDPIAGVTKGAFFPSPGNRKAKAGHKWIILCTCFPFFATAEMPVLAPGKPFLCQ